MQHSSIDVRKSYKKMAEGASIETRFATVRDRPFIAAVVVDIQQENPIPVRNGSLTFVWSHLSSVGRNVG